MTKVLILLAVGALAAVAAAQPASAFSRKPYVLSDLRPDRYGYTTTAGERVVRRDYYPAAERIYCAGVIMKGAERDSSWVRGLTRYWDKLYCAALVNPSAAYVFVLDAKATGRVLYRHRTVRL